MMGLTFFKNLMAYSIKNDLRESNHEVSFTGIHENMTLIASCSAFGVCLFYLPLPSYYNLFNCLLC